MPVRRALWVTMKYTVRFILTDLIPVERHGAVQKLFWPLPMGLIKGHNRRSLYIFINVRPCHENALFLLRMRHATISSRFASICIFIYSCFRIFFLLTISWLSSAIGSTDSVPSCYMYQNLTSCWSIWETQLFSSSESLQAFLMADDGWLNALELVASLLLWTKEFKGSVL